MARVFSSQDGGVGVNVSTAGAVEITAATGQNATVNAAVPSTALALVPKCYVDNQVICGATSCAFTHWCISGCASTLSADVTEDTLCVVGGCNFDITIDPTNDTICYDVSASPTFTDITATPFASVIADPMRLSSATSSR